jgi:hypothetical protein
MDNLKQKTMYKLFLFLSFFFFIGSINAQTAPIKKKAYVDEQKILNVEAATPRAGYISAPYRKADGNWYEKTDAGVEQLIIDTVAMLATKYDLFNVTGVSVDTINEIATKYDLSNISVDTINEIATKYDLQNISIDTVLEIATKYDLSSLAAGSVDTINEIATKYDLTNNLIRYNSNNDTIDFLRATTFGSEINPLEDTVFIDLSNPKFFGKQHFFHKASTAPEFHPVNGLIEGMYIPNKVNFFEVEYITSTRYHIKINNGFIPIDASMEGIAVVGQSNTGFFIDNGGLDTLINRLERDYPTHEYSSAKYGRGGTFLYESAGVDDWNVNSKEYAKDVIYTLNGFKVGVPRLVSTGDGVAFGFERNGQYNGTTRKGTTIKYFIWIQGENDSQLALYADEYEANIEAFFLEMKKQINNDEWKFICVRLGDPYQGQFKATINTAFETLATKYPDDVGVINTDDFVNGDYDNPSTLVHYSNQGAVKVAQKIIDLIILKNWF